MAQVGNLDFRGFIDNKKDERANGSEAQGHAYAYASDKHTRSAFERAKPVEYAVTSAVRLFKQIGKNEMLGHAVKVGPKQFVRVHALVQECARTLDIAPPAVYIKNSPVMNAMTYGTNDDSFIIVHSALVDHFTDEELMSVIGHECGHIHNSHVIYLTALHYLKHMASIYLQWVSIPAGLALSGWMRRAEITCDRAGLLCSRNVDVSNRALAKLALGSQKLYDEFNMEAFLDQYEEGKDGIGKYAEITASHPWLPKRLHAIKAFSESELYKRHIGSSEPGLTMEQVDEKVHEIIKVLG